ncbi:MAG: 2-phosphosulfolactate phosphatase [Chloroflexi bacterium]|nr:2-phosphosulfolactate phosphatase [Chloroflexota bacterium]
MYKSLDIDVAVLPGLAKDLQRKVCIVIDVLRATTTLVTMFERGCREVTLAVDVGEARLFSAKRDRDCLLVGELGGLPPEDFHYGNSPVELAQVDLSGREAVFCTSNGTKAITRVSEANMVLAGCMRNGQAVVDKAISAASDSGCDITIVTSGKVLSTSFALDDFFTAGYLVYLIRNRPGLVEEELVPELDFSALAGKQDPGSSNVIRLDDSAIAAYQLYLSYAGATATPSVEEVLVAFKQSGNGKGLALLGLAHDTVFAAHTNTSAVVPVLHRDDAGICRMTL